MPLPVYTGPFGPAQAERLLWRAGFGPRPGEDRTLAATGPRRRRRSLSSRPARTASSASRRTSTATALPARQVRPRPPLVARPDGAHEPAAVERMTLVWHDWFATSNETVGCQRLMLRQNELFRRSGLGSFQGLAMRVTTTPRCCCTSTGSTRQGRPERELRARADGALHARPRQRLHASATSASRPAPSPA